MNKEKYKYKIAMYFADGEYKFDEESYMTIEQITNYYNKKLKQQKTEIIRTKNDNVIVNYKNIVLIRIIEEEKGK